MANMTSESLKKVSGGMREFNSKVQDTEEYLEKMSHDAGKKIGAMASDFAETTSGYVKTSREYVQENPVKSVAVAAAAGLVAGSLITWAMRPHE